MKILKYQIMREVNHGTEEEPNIVQTFHDCVIECVEKVFESNLAIAKKEAYNGEVTVEEVEDPIAEPTLEEKRDAQLFYTAMMTDTLLNFEEE